MPTIDLPRLAYIIEHATRAKLEQAGRVCEGMLARLDDASADRSAVIDLANASDLMIRSLDTTHAGSDYSRACRRSAINLCLKHR